MYSSVSMFANLEWIALDLFFPRRDSFRENETAFYDWIVHRVLGLPGECDT